MYRPDIGLYLTYGLAVWEDQRLVKTQHDVCVSKQIVENIARMCTDGQLDPVHLMDVILNMLP